MTDREILDLYKSIVPFFAQVCGTSCEILIHDLTNTEASVIAIENGFNSGRTIGSPITDLAKKIIESGDYEEKDYLANYSGLGKGQNFISSTFFIKNEGRLIGLLCVNRNTASISALDAALGYGNRTKACGQCHS
jgi:predicted transcriptional regulator YheO